MDWTFILVVSALIVVVAILRAWQSIRHSSGTERGSLPGTGHHIIDAEYHSGGGGGGHSAQYRVPRDPQEYAKTFIPKDKRK